MLSTENPPPDLPYLCEISQLKSSRSDEKDSDINQHQFEVDLFKTGLDDNNPLPKFSIRDYVFSTRGKDIKTNWPFSTGNLQLCLKNGVNDVLPPFQSLDSVRNQLVAKQTIHNTSNSDEKLSPLGDHLLSVSSENVSQKLVVRIENINSSGSDEDKDFPSTTTSQSYSDTNLVSPLRSTYLVPEAQKLPGKSEEKIESPIPASSKVESSIQNPVKKCRLMVKLSNIAVPKSNEDSAANTSVLSETMASKVCPVCKTFSSSSNTTLNAHIDQCLSKESTIKWTTNSKVIKHRIKPRKTRLMVDIYATALCCTLEDLDRRNGTNWASNSGFRAQEFETCAELKNKAFSSVNIENKNEEGAVYIDSSGTKLRILSKFNDLHSSSSVKGDCGPKNLLKKDKGSKFLACKKKNDLVRKLKLLKCSYEQRRCSPRTNPCLEDGDSQLRKFTSEEGCEKEDPTQPLKAYDQMKYNDFGMIKRWVGSKRSGLKKKINLENENWYPDKIMKNLGVKRSMSSSNNRFMKRTSDLNSSVLSDKDLLLPTEGSRIKENSSCNSHHECKEPLSLKKRVGFSLLESRNCHDKRNNMALTQCNVKQPRRDGPSVHELHMDLSSIGNHVSAQSNKRMELNITPAKNADADRQDITPRLSQQHALSSGAKCSYERKTSLNHEFSPRGKYSSLRKNLFPPQHASVPESKKSTRRKCLELKKRRLHYTSESDEGTQVLQSTVCKQDSLIEELGENAVQMDKASVKSYINGTRVLKIQKMRGEFLNSWKEGAMTSKNSETSSESDIPVGKNFDSFVGGNVPLVTSNVLDAVQEAEIPEKFVYEQTSKIHGGAFMGFSKSLGSAFPAVAGPSGVECISQHCIKALEEGCPAERILGVEQNMNMFYADKFGKDMVVHNANAVTGMDSIEGNYFVDVDPIPIPGPPGSFLPSPGHVGSEELQGNSSLTTCRVQSSEEEQELVDMDSSDSPVSATSMVSISNALRSDSASFELQSNGPQHETGHDKSGAKTDPSVESSTPYETAARGDGNLEFAESRANLTFPETSSSRFKNSQPCCCSRKEGVAINVSLNSQDSLLLQRRSVSSRPLLTAEKEMGGDPKKKLNSFNLRSETLTVNEPSPGSEKSIVNSPMGYGPVLVSYNSEAKFPTCGDSEFPSPSTSNPVLRLMGKNLLVVNKDEDVSPQTRSPRSIMINDYTIVRSCINDKIQSGNSSHLLLSRDPSTFDHMQSSMLAQLVDFSSSNGFKNPGNLGTPCLSSQPSTVVLPSKNFGQRFTSSLEHHKHVGGCTLAPEQLGSKIRLDTPITCDTDQKVQTAIKLRTSDFSISNNKEIIILDDSHESGLAVEATPGQLNMEAGKSMVGISASMVWGYESSHVSPFYSLQKRGHGGSQVVPDENIFGPTFKGRNADAVKWNCTAKGSSELHSNSLTASSSSTGHRGSVLYYPPSFT